MNDMGVYKLRWQKFDNGRVSEGELPFRASPESAPKLAKNHAENISQSSAQYEFELVTPDGQEIPIGLKHLPR